MGAYKFFYILQLELLPILISNSRIDFIEPRLCITNLMVTFNCELVRTVLHDNFIF